MLTSRRGQNGVWVWVWVMKGVPWPFFFYKLMKSEENRKKLEAPQMQHVLTTNTDFHSIKTQLGPPFL
jgi:hypothetical protein